MKVRIYVLVVRACSPDVERRHLSSEMLSRVCPHVKTMKPTDDFKALGCMFEQSRQ